MRTALVIPIHNPGAGFADLLASLARQTFRPEECYVMDTESSDGSSELATAAGFQVVPIARDSFDHGGTRQQAVDMTEADALIFLTQDAVLAETDSLARLMGCLTDGSIGAAFGRQLPRIHAGPLESHARLFNYPPISRHISAADIASMGLRAAFFSDSFAVYRRKALAAVGGFPRRIISAEDMAVAAKLLLAGWHIAYCSEATVYHSHSYSITQEFSRYFDIGVMHAEEKALLGHFGAATGEGRRFVVAEQRYIWHAGCYGKAMVAILRNAVKLLGYHCGRSHRWLPHRLKRRCSMNPRYWRK